MAYKSICMMFKICPGCRAHLDHGERCGDCYAKKDGSPKGEPSYTESEQSDEQYHSNAILLYHKMSGYSNTESECYQMKLLKMSLENYQGIRKANFNFNGRNANIYGDNATGKTTIFNAFTWLIFGKASNGTNDYTPKTKTQDGDAHNLDHAVECDIEINGELVTFRRVYHEVYKKTRGNAEVNFSGHTTDYFIDGVPKKEKEYSKYWENIFENEEIPKLLSMLFYFAETLHWEKRRSILLDICGIVSDNAIMETDEELKQLPALLGSRSIDEYRKIIRASLTEINRKIQSIPARIDEAEKAIPDNTGYTSDDLESQLAVIRDKISDAEKERAGILANDASTSPTRTRISELNLTLTEERRKYSEKQQTATAGLYETVNECRKALSEAEGKLANSKRARDKAQSDVSAIEKKRNDIFTQHRNLQEYYNKVSSDVFDEAATVCVTCGQDLPQGKANELRQAFNLHKSNTLSDLTNQMNDLVERGKKEASKDMLAAAQQAVIDTDNAVTTAEADVETSTKKLQEAEENCKKATLPPFEQTDSYKTIAANIAAAKSEETQAAPDTSAVDARIAEYRNEEKSLNTTKATLETEKVQRARIDELEKQERELGQSYEKGQRSLYLCEKFSRVKAALLTDKINERFKTVSFQLFKKNITNDGIDDVCEVLIPAADGKLVPFNLANNAAKINAGIEIIDVLSEYYEVELPLFIDNAESVTRIIPFSGQLIRLIVSESDKQLRLELL